MKYLVDTCVVSEFARPKPNASVLAWFKKHQTHDEFFISTVSIGELECGIAALDDGDSRKARFATWLRQRILPAFEGRVLDYTVDIALKWGDIMGVAKRTGHTRPDIDAQIAATAVVHDMIVLTRNTRDMDYTGAQTCNPFKN